jgi:hypothetical protein
MLIESCCGRERTTAVFAVDLGLVSKRVALVLMMSHFSREQKVVSPLIERGQVGGWVSAIERGLVVKGSTLEQARDVLDVGLWVRCIALVLVLVRGVLAKERFSAHLVAVRGRRRSTFVLLRS